MHAPDRLEAIVAYLAQLNREAHSLRERSIAIRARADALRDRSRDMRRRSATAIATLHRRTVALNVRDLFLHDRV
jgi:hypothetical protein